MYAGIEGRNEQCPWHILNARSPSSVEASRACYCGEADDAPSWRGDAEAADRSFPMAARIAVALSDMDSASPEISGRLATYWTGIVTGEFRALSGLCAKASDVAATAAVVASEITRLRTNDRENKIIFTSAQVRHRMGGSPTASPGRFLKWFFLNGS
jgi:hypothetical protein